MKRPLTQNLVEAIQPPERGYVIHYDTKLPGFGVRVTASGVKTYVFRRRVHGELKQVKIGRHPEWTVNPARDRAMKLAVMMSEGIDPNSKMKSEREAPTFADVWEKLYRPLVLNRKNDHEQKNEQQMYNAYIKPAIGSKRLKNITHDDVVAMHSKISVRAPIRANRVVAVVRCAFNKAIQSRWTDHNPATGVTKNDEQPRHRLLTDEERQRLIQVLNEHPNRRMAQLILFLMLTGARRGETMKATWDQIDFKRGTWIKPSHHTKQRRVHAVPLSTEALALLLDIRKGTNSKFIFPQKSDPEAPTVEPRKFWLDVLKRAELTDFRMHDLRHNFASVLAMSGVSLLMIGKLLGHTQTATTARYAHLAMDPLRSAAEIAAQEMGIVTKNAVHHNREKTDDQKNT